MRDPISLSQPEELCLQIENIIFRLLIHKNRINDKSKSAESVLYTTMHTHVSSEFFVCERGEITIKIPTGNIVLQSGDCAIIPPGIRHYRSKIDSPPDSVGYTVSFLCHKRNVREGEDLYKMIAPFVSGRQIVIFRNRPEICESVARIVRKTNNNNVLTVMSMVELLIKVSELPYHKVEPIENETATEPQSNDIQRMMKLDQLINVFFMRDLTVEEVASHLYISSRQLDRIVRKRYGKTLHCVIIDKRIDTAAEMLLSTDMTVDNIGVAVGFGSKAGFYREFSKRHEMTPAEFRRKNNKR